MTQVKAPFFRARRLGHANLFVTDVERSLEFYNTVVGLEVVYKKVAMDDLEGPAVGGFLSNGNTHHDIAVFRHPTAPRLNHLAFELECEADLVEGYRAAVEAGGEFRVSDHDITRSLYTRDPDGNGIEIYSDSTKEWRKIRGDGRTVRYGEPEWTPGDPPRFTAIDSRNYHEDPDLRRVEGAVFHPKRITHAALNVGDLEASIDFYTGVLGLQMLAGSIAEGYVELGGTADGRHIILMTAPDPGDAGLHHAGFEVWGEAELEESRSSLRGSGVKVEREMDGGERWGMVIRDPDGFLLEFGVGGEADPLCPLVAGALTWQEKGITGCPSPDSAGCQ